MLLIARLVDKHLSSVFCVFRLCAGAKPLLAEKLSADESDPTMKNHDERWLDTPQSLGMNILRFSAFAVFADSSVVQTILVQSGLLEPGVAQFTSKGVGD